MMFCMLLPVMLLRAQEVKWRVAVLAIDSKGTTLDIAQLANITRVEMERLDQYEVLGKFDLEEKAKNNGINLADCYGKDCLIRAGRLINADFILTGSIDLYTQSIMISYRMIRVKDSTVYKSTVGEFGNYPQEIQAMIRITLQRMHNIPFDEQLNSKLTKKFDYENPINEPMVNQLNLTGPRMGMTYIFGPDGKTMKASTDVGGFGLNPLMFQLGYQFEKQYLNGGVYQALFECIPIITGIDQSKFIPSVALVNGLRNNKNGLEFGIGAIVSLTTIARVFRGSDGNYYPVDSWTLAPNQLEKPTKGIVERFDSRGNTKLMTAIIIAFGKSFRTGSLNVPVNCWIMPQKDAIRVGISVGFNSKR